MNTLESQRGHEQGLYQGYRYRIDRRNADRSISWRCVVKSCAGRIMQLENTIINVISEHNHASNPAKIIIEKVKAKVRARAIHGIEKPRQIMQQCTAGIPLESEFGYGAINMIMSKECLVLHCMSR